MCKRDDVPKREREIVEVQNVITELNRELKNSEKTTNESRVNAVTFFFDNIDSVAEGEEKNELYKTIIDCIIYRRNGENIDIDIKYK